MTPPEAPVTDLLGRGAGSTPAVSISAPENQAADSTPPDSKTDAKPVVAVLRKRADFLRAAGATKQGTPGFLLQARTRGPEEPVNPDLIRIGFTCSKKVGNSVMRNRARRRLREIARLVLAGLARPGWDYVLIGRPEATINRDFVALQNDLRRAVDDIHSGRASSKSRPPRPAGEPPKGRRRGKG